MMYARLIFYTCSMGLILTACTYSITMVHTQGDAKDVVDETQSNTPHVSPTITAVPGV